MAQKITKADLVERIFQNTNLPKKDIQLIMESLFDEVKLSLCEGSNIEIRTFGTFELRLRKARKNCRNPKTGEKVQMDSHYVAAFRPGKELKEDLWKLKI